MTFSVYFSIYWYNMRQCVFRITSNQTRYSTDFQTETHNTISKIRVCNSLRQLIYFDVNRLIQTCKAKKKKHVSYASLNLFDMPKVDNSFLCLTYIFFFFKKKIFSLKCLSDRIIRFHIINYKIVNNRFNGTEIRMHDVYIYVVYIG